MREIRREEMIRRAVQANAGALAEVVKRNAVALKRFQEFAKKEQNQKRRQEEKQECAKSIKS